VAGQCRWCSAGERGGVRDLPDAKVGFDEGLSAKVLTVGIGHLVVMLFVVSAGVFLLSVQRAWASPSWAASLQATLAQAAKWWAAGGIHFSF
jgi:hypothetical protein